MSGSGSKPFRKIFSPPFTARDGPASFILRAVRFSIPLSSSLRSAETVSIRYPPHSRFFP
ncbi:MAG: hypothetical protein BWZ01_02095 [Deltaproteobacteria bacterium ADurb.BinA179]|nr:MAG: hypothetical protein BWZ01_02095 [Deltaproteobacteria bacterium ADurb.BinA179]